MLVYAPFSAMVGKVLCVSAYTGLVGQSFGHSGSDTEATLPWSILRCDKGTLVTMLCINTWW